MSKIEELEQKVQALSPEELAQFASGSWSSIGLPGTGNSSGMFVQASSMR